MKHNTSASPRKARFRRVTLLLTVFTVAAVLLLNILVSSLAERFGWYVNMGRIPSYDLSDDCRAVISDLIDDADARRAAAGEDPFVLRILFCQEKEALEQDDYLYYIHRMACQLGDAFPDSVRVEYIDLWRNPTAVAKYRGEGEERVSIPDYAVILDGGDRYRVLYREDFYELNSEDYNSTKGFSGNSLFATTVSYLTSDTIKRACLTVSHGEIYSDYEIKHLLADAGYTVSLIDLRVSDIPADCTLLVTYAPDTDFLDMGTVTDVSELEKLGAFLGAGNSFFVFLGPDTPRLPNLERFLADWGVGTDIHTVTSVDGRSEDYRYMIRNSGASLTSDGYTIRADLAPGAVADETFSRLDTGRGVIFPDCTSLSPAEGWTVSEDGASWTLGDRTASALYTASNGSAAYAAGKRVGNGGSYTLMTLTEDRSGGGSVAVSASLGVVSGDVMQSVVRGNRQAMLCLLDRFDGGVVLGIEYATWPSTVIESITTSQMRWLTVLLVALPAVAATVIGTVVLLRRKRT